MGRPKMKIEIPELTDHPEYAAAQKRVGELRLEIAELKKRRDEIEAMVGSNEYHQFGTDAKGEFTRERAGIPEQIRLKGVDLKNAEMEFLRLESVASNELLAEARTVACNQSRSLVFALCDLATASAAQQGLASKLMVGGFRLGPGFSIALPMKFREVLTLDGSGGSIEQLLVDAVEAGHVTSAEITKRLAHPSPGLVGRLEAASVAAKGRAA